MPEPSRPISQGSQLAGSPAIILDLFLFGLTYTEMLREQKKEVPSIVKIGTLGAHQL